MKKVFALTALLAIVLMACAFNGCNNSTSPEMIARDTIAASKGFIEDQQAKNLAKCQADPTQQVCELINQAIAAQNLAIDALDTYCAGPDYTAGGACVPNKDALPKLQQAMTHLEDILKQLKAFGVVKAGIGDPGAGGFLYVIQLVLGMLGPILAGLKVNPLYASIAESVEKAIEELQKAREKALTHEQLESLRTKPKW